MIIIVIQLQRDKSKKQFHRPKTKGRAAQAAP